MFLGRVRYTDVDRLAQTLRRFAVAVPLGSVATGLLVLIGLSLFIEHKDGPAFAESGSVYQCTKAMQLTPELDPDCPHQQSLAGAVIHFRETGPFWRTFTARTGTGGIFTVNLPAGHYRVSLDKCGDYPLERKFPLEVTVDSHGWAGWNPPSLSWVVDPSGGRWQAPSLGL
jgi:hypothetical protein